MKKRMASDVVNEMAFIWFLYLPFMWDQWQRRLKCFFGTHVFFYHVLYAFGGKTSFVNMLGFYFFTGFRLDGSYCRKNLPCRLLPVFLLSGLYYFVCEKQSDFSDISNNLIFFRGLQWYDLSMSVFVRRSHVCRSNPCRVTCRFTSVTLQKCCAY